MGLRRSPQPPVYTRALTVSIPRHRPDRGLDGPLDARRCDARSERIEADRRRRCSSSAAASAVDGQRGHRLGRVPVEERGRTGTGRRPRPPLADPHHLPHRRHHLARPGAGEAHGSRPSRAPHRPRCARPPRSRRLPRSAAAQARPSQSGASPTSSSHRTSPAGRTTSSQSSRPGPTTTLDPPCDGGPRRARAAAAAPVDVSRRARPSRAPAPGGRRGTSGTQRPRRRRVGQAETVQLGGRRPSSCGSTAPAGEVGAGGPPTALARPVV